MVLINLLRNIKKKVFRFFKKRKKQTWIPSREEVHNTSAQGDISYQELIAANTQPIK